MKILFFGDVFGRPGREVLCEQYDILCKEHNPDFVIANIENIAHGMGITLTAIEELGKRGALFHAFTSGNHHFANQGVYDVISHPAIPLVRPLNYQDAAGVGARVVESGARRLLVVNVMGRIFMKDTSLSNPFLAMNDILQKYTIDPHEDGKERVDGIFVDIHAETTAEKRAMGFHLDGRVSAVVGTHTHVPTRDEQILRGGTAYISDVGMVGPFHSSLGLDKDSIVEEMVQEQRTKRDVSDESLVEIGAVLIKVKENGLSDHIQHIRLVVNKS